jgi:hypothetical protein
MWYTKQAQFNFYSEECVRVFEEVQVGHSRSDARQQPEYPRSYDSKPTYVTTSCFFLCKLQELITCTSHYLFCPSVLLRG